MEAPLPAPVSPAAPRLRLLENREPASASRPVSLRAWVVLYGSLCFSAGHGVFLFTALTRLQKIPSRSEFGEGLELAVLAWFVGAVPLAFLSALLRKRFQRLHSGFGWSLALTSLTLTVAAFVWYLRAVALA